MNDKLQHSDWIANFGHEVLGLGSTRSNLSYLLRLGLNCVILVCACRRNEINQCCLQARETEVHLVSSAEDVSNIRLFYSFAFDELLDLDDTSKALLIPTRFWRQRSSLIIARHKTKRARPSRHLSCNQITTVNHQPNLEEAPPSLEEVNQRKKTIESVWSYYPVHSIRSTNTDKRLDWAS